MIPDVTPPQAEQTEKAMIASLVANRATVDAFRGRIKPEHFYSAHFGAVWAWIDANGWADLAILTDRFPTASGALQGAVTDCQSMIWDDVTPYLDILVEMYQRREMIKIAVRMHEAARTNYDNNAYALADEIRAQLDALTERRQSKRIRHIAEMLPEVYADLEACTRGERAGIMSGLIDVDAQAGGYQEGDFVVLAARPGMGKSSFATNVIRHNAVQKKIPCLVFTLEMDERLATARTLFAEAGQSYDAALRGLLTKENYIRLGEVTTPLSEAPIYFDDTAAIALPEVVAKTKKMCKTAGIKLVIMDHMQLMGTGKSRSRNEEVSEITAGLKSLARDQKIVVIGLSQLNRSCESRHPAKPMLSDLRDSGSIEQDADKVMFLYREEKYDPKTDRKGICDVIVAKNRNGRCGEIETRFNGSAMRFENVTRDNFDEPPQNGTDR